ncbi:MAG: protein-glutamate O-methyltransferase CheR [Phycisphaerales bacterium]
MSLISEKQFDVISRIAQEHWGLHLTEKKMQLVNNRLGKFLRKSRFESVNAYLDHLGGSPSPDDLLEFFDLLSTNVTSFFREIQHFNYLERELYTPLARGNITKPGKRIRLWSAACSTGPEPYSMAIQAMELMPELRDWDFKILATDLSNTALACAKQATYPLSMVEKVDPKTVAKYFERNVTKGQVRVKPALRKLVTIRRLNLMESFPVRGPFDVIFLRNVMIYFDKPTRERLVNQMYKVLGPGGVFVIGSAETLSGLDTPFKMVQPAVYVK